jgi:hypothetical protein
MIKFVFDRHEFADLQRALAEIRTMTPAQMKALDLQHKQAVLKNARQKNMKKTSN